MLIKREAFKVAFLLRCAELGLTMDETHQLVKTARARLREKRAGPRASALANIPGLQTLAAGTTGAVSGTTSALARNAVNMGMLGIFGLPLLVGGVGGIAAAKAHDLNDRDAEEIKLEEKKDALRRAAVRARMQTASRKRREERRPSRPLL